MQNKTTHTMPGFLIAAVKSGSGKTMLTCGLLQLLKNHGLRLSAFKCGPDFIDPMFHTRVLNIPSRNLDTYFTSAKQTRDLFTRACARQRADLAVIEGVMGYYDGAGMTTAASSYELASVLQVPAVLVVDAAGMGNCVVPMVKGYLDYRAPSNIAGVLFNKVSSASMYAALKEAVERELKIRAVGYLPRLSQAEIESRHLGLVRPREIQDIRKRVQYMADVMEQTVDRGLLLEIAGLHTQKRQHADPSAYGDPMTGNSKKQHPKQYLGGKIRIAVAKDEAFCFYYQDNLDLLESLGAVLIPFSPLLDQALPDAVQGLLLGGGYPELYADRLCANEAMRADIRQKIADGLPFLAECGGFLYLKETLDNHPMVGALSGSAFAARQKPHFGYVELTAQTDTVFGPVGTKLRGHEFHYYDTTENGSAFLAKKPFRDTSWMCMQAGKNYAAGFAHLYFYSNPKAAEAFLHCCRRFREETR